jgi:hypothetical protein
LRVIPAGGWSRHEKKRGGRNLMAGFIDFASKFLALFALIVGAVWGIVKFLVSSRCDSVNWNSGYVAY